MKYILMATLIAVATPGFSQDIPEKMKTSSAKTDRIIKNNELTEDEREYLWKNTVSDRRGFIQVEVSPQYVDLIDDSLKTSGSTKIAPKKSYPVKEKLNSQGYEFLSIFKEDNDRYNMVFRNPENNLLMFTRWDYKKSGASFTLSEEFLNCKIKNSPATLSLATAKNVAKGIWKLAWSKDGVAYELYLSDKINEYGIPQGTFTEIIDLANIIMESELSSEN